MRNGAMVAMVVLAVTAMLGAVRAAAETDLSRTATVLLTLSEGIRPAEPGDRETRDMELELTLRDGAFEKKVWGFAIGFNKGDHDGEVVSSDGEKLTVKMSINPDRWWPKKPGEAEYRIVLKRDGDSYAGSFEGTFAVPGNEGMQKQEVKGKVTGKAYPLWTEPREGFKKLVPNEHPRLIFRKSDLPMLKKRLETPEGKAIMARFLAQLPKQHATHTKNKPFFPAGYALAYQLTGDKAHADKAKELLSGMLNLGGSQDIHYGPLAQSMAVTLDLCYDAWDAEFRQTVIDNLAKRTRDLFYLQGGARGGASMSPWHNHEGIRAGSGGVAAICLIGEKTSDGKDIPEMERMAHVFTRSIRRYFQFDGTSNTGFCLEGSFYKRMTWNSGPGNLIQAYRTALGGDPLAGWPGHWSILGEWMDEAPSDRVVKGGDLGNDQSAGLWPIGLVTVPDSMKAGARWLYDRSYGLKGDRTFGIQWAYHAGYVLMNYPFDVPARPPSESMPWVAPDPTGGHWIFRKPWQDKSDTLVVLHLRSGLWRGCHHGRSGRTWDMQLFALGRQWIGEGKLGEKGGAGAALPTVGNRGALNDVLGPLTTYWNATPEGKAVLSLDMTPVYMQALRRGAKPAADQKTATFIRSGRFIDHGVRANRYVALDLSGACGAPVLFALLDRAEGAEDFTWNMELAEGAGPIRAEGNTFTVGDPAGPHLRAFFVPSPGLDLVGREEKVAAPREVPSHVPEAFRGMVRKPAPTREPATLRARGSRHYFVVLTVQNGAAPEVKAEGEGLAAKVSVGRQTVRFDGEKPAFGQ